MNTHLFEQARQLSLPEQLELVEALWENIASRGGFLMPGPAQAAELDRRLAAFDAHPDDLIVWSDVKAALSQIGQ